MSNITVLNKHIVLDWEYENEECGICGKKLYMPSEDDMNNEHVIYNTIIFESGIGYHKSCLKKKNKQNN